MGEVALGSVARALARALALGLALALALGVGAAGPAAGQEASDLSGVWRGRYDCNQGITGLTLTLAPAAATDRGSSALQGRFIFYEAPNNPGVPTGCFEMRGAVGLDGRIELIAGAWLLRPDGYVTVDLSGAVSEGGAAISGDVIGPGCTRFALRRDAPQVSDEEARCTLGDVAAAR
ncbi:MAG: hypothetical protein AAFW46_00605 [Pseudomonadota bacterium]